jgi:hypothetical protein
VSFFVPSVLDFGENFVWKKILEIFCSRNIKKKKSFIVEKKSVSRGKKLYLCMYDDTRLLILRGISFFGKALFK